MRLEDRVREQQKVMTTALACSYPTFQPVQDMRMKTKHTPLTVLQADVCLPE